MPWTKTIVLDFMNEEEMFKVRNNSKGGSGSGRKKMSNEELWVLGLELWVGIMVLRYSLVHFPYLSLPMPHSAIDAANPGYIGSIPNQYDGIPAAVERCP